MKGRKRERENPCFICGHYHNYEAGEPCSVCGHAPACAAEPQGPTVGAFPTEVVPGFLYLGSYDHASRSELLKAMGIKRILNTVPDCQNLYRNTFTYHTASALPHAPKEVPLGECIAFIDESRAAGEKVMVHCMSGSSRSASVVLAYLIRQHRMRLAHCHAWLKERRPTVNLQPAAAAQLEAFEVEALGEEARTPPPPLPPSNPLPRNDAPFGVIMPSGPFTIHPSPQQQTDLGGHGPPPRPNY